MVQSVVGGFGSAGSSRSLRKTATGAGVGHTFAVLQLMGTKKVPPVVNESPTVKELRQSLRTNQCCFCLSTKTYKSLSLHWSMGHGIDLQEIRDVLEVRKKTSFISDDLRDVFSRRGKRLYNPDRLRNKGRPRELTAYGVKIQRAKLQIARTVQTVSGRRHIPRICAICGDTFYAPNGKVLKSCKKKACQFATRSKAHKGRVNTWSNPPHKPPRDRQCHCGKTFNPRRDFGSSGRLTCSQGCLTRSLVLAAKARVSHLAAMNERRLGTTPSAKKA